MLHGRTRPFSRTAAGSAGTFGAFQSAVIANGGTISAGRQTLYTNLFNSLASAGLVAKIGRLGIMAAENSASARVDLMAPSKLLTFVGAPTFTANQGVVSTNATNYVDTGFSAGGLFQQDSAFTMVGSLSVRAVGADMVMLGNAQLAGGTCHYAWTTGNVCVPGINMASIFATNYVNPAATVKGLYVNTRRSVAGQEEYFNGVSKNTSSQSSAAPIAQSFLIGCWRNTDGTSVYAFDSGPTACWAAGTQLSAGEVTALTTAINTYMTAIGSPLF